MLEPLEDQEGLADFSDRSVFWRLDRQIGPVAEWSGPPTEPPGFASAAQHLNDRTAYSPASRQSAAAYRSTARGRCKSVMRASMLTTWSRVMSRTS